MTYASTILSRCADCGLGTITAGEYFMVRDEIWKKAWAGRRKPWHALPGQEILCVGCLEARIGHTLMACDFTDAPCNDLNDDSYRSERLLNRLAATEGKCFLCQQLGEHAAIRAEQAHLHESTAHGEAAE